MTISLSYQPAFDPYHTIFRILRLFPILVSSKRVEIQKLMVLDFYLAFPFRAKEIRLRPGDVKYRRMLSHYDTTKPYGHMPDDKTIFARMNVMQRVAFHTLANSGYIDLEALELGWIISVGSPPEALTHRIAELNTSDSVLIEFLDILAKHYPLQGSDGLKARTGLLEFRYDTI